MRGASRLHGAPPMKAAVVTFPGSNCDRDLAVAFEAAGFEVARVWHKDTALPKGIDVVGVPGGFSFGDYLRCGAIAAQSPIGAAVRGACGAGRLCAGHLQRLSGADRDGAAAGRADAQCRAEVRLPDGDAAGRDDRQRLYLGLRCRASVDPVPDRPSRRQLHHRRRGPGARCRARIASPLPMPQTRTARWPTSPASCRTTAACWG